MPTSHRPKRVVLRVVSPLSGLRRFKVRGSHNWKLHPEVEFGIPADVPCTVLTECLFCPAMIETQTGLEGVAEMEKAGREAVAGGDWACSKCAESRAEIVGDER